MSMMAPGLGGGESGAPAPMGTVEDSAVVVPVLWGASVVTAGGGRGNAVGVAWWA